MDAIEQGADGCLWLGTTDGLSCYREGRFRNYSTRDGLPNDRVISLRADREGGLWVGTAGGLTRFREGRFETFSTADALAGGIILSIFEDAEGSLWVGTESGGLSQLSSKHQRKHQAKARVESSSEPSTFRSDDLSALAICL